MLAAPAPAAARRRPGPGVSSCTFPASATARTGPGGRERPCARRLGSEGLEHDVAAPGEFQNDRVAVLRAQVETDALHRGVCENGVAGGKRGVHQDPVFASDVRLIV